MDVIDDMALYFGKMSGDASFQTNFSSLAEAIMMQLCNFFLNKGLNVTAENLFSSLPLVKRLQEHKGSSTRESNLLTVVG